jgi:hypothetical protein
MRRSVVVTYQLRPEAYDQHVRLIESVFEQLHRERPTELEYTVLVLEDGVSFVHVSTSETVEGASPLPRFEAFRQFNEDIASRVATPPRPSAATLVGAYRPHAEEASRA